MRRCLIHPCSANLSDNLPAMEPVWAGAQGDTERRLWSTIVQTAAAELAERALEISDAVTEFMSVRLPGLLGSPDAREASRASTEGSIRDFAEVMRSGSDPEQAETLPSATLEYAVDGARRSVPLATLTRSYRLGHAAVSQHLKAILERHVDNGDDLNRAADLCSAWLFEYVDVALCRVEEVYTAERDRWLRSAATTQTEMITAILSGQPVDIDVASRALRHDLRHVHVAANAWVDTHEEGRNTLAVLEAAIRDIGAAIGTQRPLVQPLGTLSVAAWITTTSAPPSRVLDELRFRTAKAPGVRVAVGEPGCGMAGFRTSHTQAEEAQRIARLGSGADGTVTRYRDIAVRALASVNLEQARDFVARELAALAASDDTTRRLAATLRTYLEENCGRAKTAKRLHIHENTVAYRLRRVEELLGGPLDERTLERRVALALVDLVGGTSGTP